MIKRSFLFLIAMAATLVGGPSLPESAMAHTAGAVCGASNDTNNPDNGTLFAASLQQITDLAAATCNVGLAAAASYDGTGFVAADTLLVMNNVNNADDGFTAGISVAAGPHVTDLLLNGAPYVAGTQIPLDTAGAFSGTLQFDFGGNTFQFSIVKPAGGNQIQGFTIEVGSPAAISVNEGFVRARTRRVISDVLVRRAGPLTANGPNLAGRLIGGFGTPDGLPAVVSANGQNGSFDVAIATSLRQIVAAERARQAGRLAEIAELLDPGDWRQAYLGPTPDMGNPAEREADTGIATGAALDRIAPSPNDLAATGPGTSLDLWIDGTWSRADSGETTNDRGLLHIGTDYRLSDDLLIGLLGQLDWSDEEDDTLDTRADSRGWMIGPYAAARLHEHLVFDARAAWGRSDDDVSPVESDSQSIDTEHWLLRGGLTGDIRLDSWHLTPGIAAIHFKQEQETNSDSPGVEIRGQTASLSQLMFGPQAAYLYQPTPDWLVLPQVGGRGIWNFGQTGVVDVAPGIATGQDSLRARVEGGVSVTYADRYTLTGDVFYEGIGADDVDAFGGSLGINVLIADGVLLDGEGFMTGSSTSAAADYGANLRLKVRLD